MMNRLPAMKSFSGLHAYLSGLRLKSLLLLLICAAFINACEVTADIKTKHKPVIQVDAVFFTGSPMPVITVKRSFDVTGKKPFDIDVNELWIRNASIELIYNGELIEVSENQPGHYFPQSNKIIQSGDRIDIVVRAIDDIVRATATVPDFEFNQISFSAQDSTSLSARTIRIDGIPRTYWQGPLPVRADFPFLPDFIAIRFYTEMELELFGDDHLRLGGTDPMDYQAYHADNYTGQTGFAADQFVSVFYPHTQDSDKPTGESEITVYYDILIPEPVYGEWHRTNSKDLTPISITNVDGGVGLFIGAIRYEQEKHIRITLY